MRNRIFHIVTVGGLEFKGLMTGDGPVIACDSRHGDVALGVCGLRKFRPDAYRGRTAPHGWWLVKYDSEARLDLADFTDADATILSDEFGIVLLDTPSGLVSEKVRQDYFFTSPAWEALCAWSRKFPRLAKDLSGSDPYLPGWYKRSRSS